MPLMMDFCAEGILGTWLTVEEIQQKCIELFGENATFGANHSMKSIGDGRGFMSKMILLNPDWQEAAPDAPKQFIVKITSARQMAELSELIKAQDSNTEDFFTSEEAKRQFEEMIRGIHNNECTVYELFKETNMTGAYEPKVYYSSKFSEENRLKGYIMMEYVPNGIPLSIYNNLSPKQLEIPLRAIARIQAASVNWTDEQRRRLSLNPFDGLYQQLFSKENIDKFLLTFRKFGGEQLEEGTAKIQEIIPNLLDLEFFKNIDKSLGMQTVFSHGDLWSSNIIWQRKTPDSELSIGAIVDYQTSHIGNAVSDFVRATSTCLSGENRRNHWEKLLETFYNEVKGQLTGQKLPYTLEKLKECYRRLFPLLGFVILPMIGPLFQTLTSDPNMENKESLIDLMMEKTECLIDDLIFYNKRNQDIRKEEEIQKNESA